MAKPSVVDAHMHLYDLNHPDLFYEHLQNPDFVHPLIGPQLGKLAERNYEVSDYLADIEGHGVDKSIHIQCAMGSEDLADEPKWLQGLSDEYGHPHAIVGEADLCDPQVGRLLERHCQYENFRGIRDFGSGDYLTSAEFARGFSMLADFDLVASLDVKWEDMEKLAELSESHPETLVVLDHAGFPTERTQEYFENWQRGIKRLAECESVYCKVSGLGMCDNAWTTDSIRPWVVHCLESFAPDRTIWSSNWPVDGLWSDYGTMIEAYREVLSVLSERDQDKVFGGNAERIYRI